MTPTQQRDARPTAPEIQSIDRLRRSRTIRRTVAVVLAIFVLLGVLGMFGSKTDVASATGAGYTLTVTYPKVTRPGLPVRWTYVVRHAGGFDGRIHVATTFDYLNLFDLSSIQPDAASVTATEDWIIWSFEPPGADTLAVTFDAATEVGIHELPAATASVLVDGRSVVRVRFRTVVMP